MSAQDDVRNARVLLEQAEAKLKSLDRIRVPEGIEFGQGGSKFGRGLYFNDSKQMLTFGGDEKNWAVGVRQKGDPVERNLYLEPCKREDLKAGDWWVCEIHSMDIHNFNLWLGDNKYAWVKSGRDISVTDALMRGVSCYKVVG
jgi:hypothetical protein